MHPRPPCRSTHTFTIAGSRVAYDRWSGPGRPVLLLHALLFDRTQWWPLAADLAASCTVVAPDLPGHGESPMWTGCTPEQVAGVLARLVESLGLRRAPVVVGHATSAPLATAFADHFAVHGVVTVDEPVDLAGSGPAAVVAASGVDRVPERFRSFAEPREDPGLVAAYRSWLDRPSTLRPVPHARHPADDLNPPRFTPLSDPESLASRIQYLL
ncbi:pimeloyl-ACP methyl ester carboxylesterase [Actinoplanes lutulentus]|uniref:Alpha/beta hydrolase family protein n=1 Tax=Actinoplanes lutulentus TaxID=1287878 RepID=A0A327Z572_9ACTN|nr:alpha/beta hydrolase [Actinoplanes lutulentus]MBB2949053.1 pimeloyl-ACP methyl ester carboxylesterase [Actinoplanes lutulentus]RAK31376.1 alpha/beta hydrolase family protein [Actinoplanes lutulentus]